MEIEAALSENLCEQKTSDKINFYLKPPVSVVSLEECEDLFRQRLEAMSCVEEAPIDSIESALKSIKSNVYLTNCVNLNVNPTPEQRKHDNISHFLARLFFSLYPEDSEQCKRFKSFERRLLNLKLRTLNCFTANKLATFLKYFNFNFDYVTDVEECQKLAKQRYIGFNLLDPSNKRIDSVFKVRFEDALGFVSKRSVAIKDGFALLTEKDIFPILSEAFENHLDNEMRVMRNTLSLNGQEQYLIENLELVYADFIAENDEKKKKMRMEQNVGRSPFSLDISNVDQISRNHFPPCMRYLHESLRKDHHLRHGGRMHFGTFLRSTGVDMDSAMDFWRDEFTKKITVNDFEKNYKYNIRHLYGKEGHKKQLSSYSCEKIIKDAPGPSDKHGCPFKHFDEKNLKTLLINYGLSNVDSDSILLAKGAQDHTRGCCEYFKFTHGDFPSEPIRNPAQFYYESVRFAQKPIKTEDEVERAATPDKDPLQPPQTN